MRLRQPGFGPRDLPVDLRLLRAGFLEVLLGLRVSGLRLGQLGLCCLPGRLQRQQLSLGLHERQLRVDDRLVRLMQLLADIRDLLIGQIALRGCRHGSGCGRRHGGGCRAWRRKRRRWWRWTAAARASCSVWASVWASASSMVSETGSRTELSERACSPLPPRAAGRPQRQLCQRPTTCHVGDGACADGPIGWLRSGPRRRVPLRLRDMPSAGCAILHAPQPGMSAFGAGMFTEP